MSTEKHPISFRVPSDTHEDFEDYQEQHDITQSDAGRRLLEEGLQSELGEEQEEQSKATQSPATRRGVVFAEVASLLAVLLTGLFVVSPGLLPAPALAWFWIVAGVANFVDVARRRGWIERSDTEADE